MWDNDTTIQPKEKEGQTNVSSALITCYDYTCRFWENLTFWFIELYNCIPVQKAQESGKGGSGKSNLVFFSETAAVVVKCF